MSQKPYRIEADSPGQRWSALTSHATNALADRPRALYVSTDGNAVIAGDDGNNITFAVVAGQWLALSPKYFRSTSTATLVGIF
jgi:hypothetical protein